MDPLCQLEIRFNQDSCKLCLERLDDQRNEISADIGILILRFFPEDVRLTYGRFEALMKTFVLSGFRK